MSVEKDYQKNEFPPDYTPLDNDIEKDNITHLLDNTPEFSANDAKFGLVIIDHNSPYANMARSTESEVFHEFFNNSPDLMKEEYGPYESASKFFLVIDKEEKRRAGVMRLLHNSESGFKATNDVKSMGITELSPLGILNSFGIEDQNSVIEIATIAAAPDYRGKHSDQMVSAAMYRALYKYCISNGYKDLIAVIDAKPLSNLVDIHLPVNISQNVRSPFEYLDAKENSLIHIPINEIERYMKARDPDAFEFLLGDPGLDPFCTLSFDEK